MGPLSTPGSQRVSGVVFSAHQRGCARGGVAISAQVAKRGRRGTVVTPEGDARGGRNPRQDSKVSQAWRCLVRKGWGRYPRQGRKAWQAWHRLDNALGAQGVGAPSTPGTQSVASAALSRHHIGYGVGTLSAPGSQSVASLDLSRHRMGCAGGGVAIRARVKKCNRCGTCSTPRGVRRG